MQYLGELPALVAIALVAASLIKAFLVQAFYIPSGSMLPTIEEGDRVLVNKLAYRFRDPRRGEVVVFVAERGPEPRGWWDRVSGFMVESIGIALPEETDYIKRVIGLPGETLVYRDGVVTITRPNGEILRLDEPYARLDTRPFGPYHVPEGRYSVMGDNRTGSSDSRFSLGTVARSDIIGKAFVRIWPPGRIGLFQEPFVCRGGVAG